MINVSKKHACPERGDNLEVMLTREVLPRVYWITNLTNLPGHAPLTMVVTVTIRTPQVMVRDTCGPRIFDSLSVGN